MMLFFALLIIIGALARHTVHLHQRRSTEEAAPLARIDAAGYYLVQFRGAITGALLRRLTEVLGYEPHDYIPINTLLLWIDSADRGEQLLRSTPHIHWIGAVDDADKQIDFRSAIDALRTQYESYRAVRMNSSGTTDSLRTSQNAFEHDADGSGKLVVRLRVVSENVSDTVLQQVAQQAGHGNNYGSAHSDVPGLRQRRTRTHVLQNVRAEDAERVAAALSRQPGVQWVELRAPYRPLNRWSVGSLHRAAGADQRTQSFGLRGSGQLLSISDTGMSTSTCFFKDSKPVPTTSLQRVPADTQHRKVRAYWSGVGGDFADTGRFAGHGTHVAGTAAGAGTGAAREYSGGAPDARIVFIDLLPAGSSTGFLEVPVQLDTTLLQWSHDLGARVHSASWGSDGNGRYTVDEQALDRFAYNNRHFLAVFAAGNSGPDPSTIASPAFAKNVLAIGAAMNGIDAVRLAQTPSRPADDYSHEWLAPFSSRGSASMAFRKPDLVAPGGAYVWSAANDAPASGACSPLGDVVMGLQGTSMAAPLVAAGAVLVREYFTTNKYPNRANISASVDTRTPTASLVRAVLVASAQPMRGVYPRVVFSTAQQRIDATGHGRVALDQVLDQGSGGGVTLAVLANEQANLAVAQQRYQRWCVEIVGTYTELVITMAYADYPSTPMARPTLINDLRLSVKDGDTEFTVNEQPKKDEKRSTIERVVVRSSRMLSVTVLADAIGFGDVQSFSLVAVLHSVDGAQLRISDPSHTSTCMRCELLENSFVPTDGCAVCGDGIVDEPLEECDGTVCCDPAACKRLDDKTPCAIVAGECRLAGTCQGEKGCVIDDRVVYGALTVDKDGTCHQVSKPPAGGAHPCTFRSSSTWERLFAEGTVIDDKRQLCCSPLRAAFEHIEFEQLFTSLAREYAAALLNSVQPDALLDATSLLLIDRARALLEANCGVGFLTSDTRRQATLLEHELRTLNEHCGDKTLAESGNACSDTSYDQRLCSSGGVYDRDTGVCLCHSNRHPGEPDCAHLACSGNGASLYNYAKKAESCACFDGWTGSDCSQCASTGVPDLVYHCIGVPLSLTALASQRRFLTIVNRATVAQRLSGALYGSVQKYDDAVPGQDDTDCWCREPTEQMPWRELDSHRDAVAAALAERSAMLVLQARAEPLLLAAANKSEQVPCKTSSSSLDKPRASSGDASVSAFTIAYALVLCALLT